MQSIDTEARLMELINQSRATQQFKKAVADFLRGQDSDLIKYSSGSPRIKVIRVLTKLLEEFPKEPISDVEIQGSSSCSAYKGILTFGPNSTKVRFDWDCRWKAGQEGFKTWFGEPDQQKAALLYGYQCFREFKKLD